MLKPPPCCGCSTMEALVRPTQIGSCGGCAPGSKAVGGDFRGMLSPREKTCSPDKALGDLSQYQEMLLSLCQGDSDCDYLKVFETLAWAKPRRWKTPRSQTFPFQNTLVQKISRT